jgi:Arc/MetJ-type ribon-helix-helix transcriptional regulator
MTTKITVSLPDEQVAALREQVRSGAARSVSALVADALAARQQRETLDELLADLERVHGPVPPEDTEWAREALRNA